MKIYPCIRYNPFSWSHIRSSLEELGYEIYNITDDWNKYPIICINFNGVLGKVGNIDPTWLDDHDRSLIRSEEDFLSIAESLLGCPLILNDIVITPGMVVEGYDSDKNYQVEVAIPTSIDNRLAFMSFTNECSIRIGSLSDIVDITCIRSRMISGDPLSGEVLWKK